jgi:hypothetical protein
VDKHVLVQPQIHPEQFASFWSTASAWGTLSQRLDENEMQLALSVTFGHLACRSVALSRPKGIAKTSSARLGEKRLQHELRPNRNETVFVFHDEVTLRSGEQLVLRLHSKLA